MGVCNYSGLPAGTACNCRVGDDGVERWETGVKEDGMSNLNCTLCLCDATASQVGSMSGSRRTQRGTREARG